MHKKPLGVAQSAPPPGSDSVTSGLIRNKHPDYGVAFLGDFKRLTSSRVIFVELRQRVRVLEFQNLEFKILDSKIIRGTCGQFIFRFYVN